MDKIIEIEAFKFNTLHKYMSPLYAEMNLRLHDQPERKKALCEGIVSKFFKRLREYREVPLEDISARYKIEIKALQLFEQGTLSPEDHFIYAYVWSCGGHREFDYFKQQLREFHQPTVKLSRIALAKDLLSRGIVLEGINYQKLHSKEAEVVTFRRKDT